jgi:hypothetical protein
MCGFPRKSNLRKRQISRIRGVIMAGNEVHERIGTNLRIVSRRGSVMSKVEQLKAEIASLPSEEFAEIFRWLSEKEWERWDKEIEADSQAGRLDFLVREVRDGKAKGTLKDL